MPSGILIKGLEHTQPSCTLPKMCIRDRYYLNPNWAADRKQKKARWEQLIRHTAYARYLGKDSYKRVLKKSRGYAVILFLTYNIPSFFLLGCFWKAYNRIR